MSAPIDKGVVEGVALLARLGLDPAQVALFAAQLGEVVRHVSSLQEVDALTAPTAALDTGLAHRRRPDIAEPSWAPSIARAAASAVRDGCFCVPAALDQGPPSGDGL